jgi:hypothetical protein
VLVVRTVAQPISAVAGVVQVVPDPSIATMNASRLITSIAS